MHKPIWKNISFIAFLFLIGVCFSSCITSKSLKYFQDLPDSTKLNNIKLPVYVTPLIHTDDVLSITIYTSDVKSTEAINASNSLSTSASAALGADFNGYIVDEQGCVEIPTLGKIKLSGLTLEKARETVTIVATKYFLNPIVSVKNKSFKITFLGEVGRPGQMYVPIAKANIIDGLAAAGDLSAFGTRSNILLLRQNNDNTISSIRIDLTKTDILKSPYFYLQSNDVLYVKPNNSKAIASDQTFTRNLTLASTALSIITTLILIIRR